MENGEQGGKGEWIEFISKAKTVQIEAKSFKQADTCWVNVQVGQTLMVYNGQE